MKVSPPSSPIIWIFYTCDFQLSKRDSRHFFASWALSKDDNQKQLPNMFYKKTLFKSSQYSQENTCVGVFFNKVADVKRDSNTCVFL